MKVAQPQTNLPQVKNQVGSSAPSQAQTGSADVVVKSEAAGEPDSMRKLALTGGFVGVLGGLSFVLEHSGGGPANIALHGAKYIAEGAAFGAAGGAALNLAAGKFSKERASYKSADLLSSGAKAGAAAVGRLATLSVVSPLVGSLASNAVAHLGGGTAAILTAWVTSTALTSAGLNIALTKAQNKFIG